MKSIEYYGIEILSQSEQKKLGVELPLGKTGDSKNTYEIITNLVIELIDKSDLPVWQKPWAVNQLGERNFPMNFDTKRAYSGVNNFLLTMLMDIRKHQCPYFLTFKQLEALKGKIRKGAKAYPICFYTSDLYRNQQGKTIQKSVWEKLPESQQKEYEPSFTLKYYNAFNAEDIEGISFGTDWMPRELPQKEQIESCENIVWSMKNRPEIYNNGGDTAAYYPLLDIIKMPLFNYFQKEQFYYSTLFHELVHSTGSPTRLEREEKKKRKSWGDSFYAYEELIAEMGACYLCGEAGILYYNLKNSAAYIKSWKAGVKNYLAEDPKFFFRACADAQRAADYILGKSDPLIYSKFKKIDSSPVDADTIIVKPKANHLKVSNVTKVKESDKVEKLKVQLSTLKEKVVQNSKFKEKIAAELKAYLSSQGLSGSNSEINNLKIKIKFYKSILAADTADFRAIARRVGFIGYLKKKKKAVLSGLGKTKTPKKEKTFGEKVSNFFGF